MPIIFRKNGIDKDKTWTIISKIKEINVKKITCLQKLLWQKKASHIRSYKYAKDEAGLFNKQMNKMPQIQKMR